MTLCVSSRRPRRPSSTRPSSSRRSSASIRATRTSRSAAPWCCRTARARTVRVLVLARGEKERRRRKPVPTIVGADEYIPKIQAGLDRRRRHHRDTGPDGRGRQAGPRARPARPHAQPQERHGDLRRRQGGQGRQGGQRSSTASTRTQTSTFRSARGRSSTRSCSRTSRFSSMKSFAPNRPRARVVTSRVCRFHPRWARR